MSNPLQNAQTRLRELQTAFDHSYIEPAREREAEPEDVLAIEIAGHPYALCVRQLIGMYVERRITPLPAAPPELLGLGAVRGELVAVYDLACLLGYARSEDPRYWVVGRARAVAFAFTTLHGQVRVAPANIATAERAREPWLNQLVRETERTRPIIDLSGLTNAIEQRIGLEGRKEND